MVSLSDDALPPSRLESRYMSSALTLARRAQLALIDDPDTQLPYDRTAVEALALAGLVLLRGEALDEARRSLRLVANPFAEGLEPTDPLAATLAELASGLGDAQAATYFESLVSEGAPRLYASLRILPDRLCRIVDEAREGAHDRARLVERLSHVLAHPCAEVHRLASDAALRNDDQTASDLAVALTLSLRAAMAREPVLISALVALAGDAWPRPDPHRSLEEQDPVTRTALELAEQVRVDGPPEADPSDGLDPDRLPPIALAHLSLHCAAYESGWALYSAGRSV